MRHFSRNDKLKNEFLVPFNQQKSNEMISRPQRLLGEALEFSFEKNPEKIAAICKGKEYSYKNLKEAAERLAYHFIAEGITKGDRIAVYMNNSWESIVAIYGISMAGAVFLVINPQTKADKLNYILKDSGSKMVISEKSQTGELLKAVSDIQKIQEIIVSGGLQFTANDESQVTDFDVVIADSENITTLPRIIPNDLAALIYTSGSTGFPKGVTMTHQSMVFTSWSLIEYLRLTEEEKILLIIPLAFDYGLYQLLMSVTIGGMLMIEQSFNFPPAIFKQIETYKPTIFPGVPSIYAILIAMHRKTGITFKSIRKVTNTAAKLPDEFISDLKKIFPNALIFKMYGLTECKRVCYLEPEFIDAKPESVGKAIPGTEVFLLTPEGEFVGPGGTGILHVRGPHVMAGYWNNEELTKEMLKPGLVPGEKILCTHDLFQMDKDGFLYFLGRSDDIIKTRGEKVSPVEVENVIYKIEGVKEVAVIGIPDVILGESIVAFITCYDHSSIDEKIIQRECQLKLESFMVPQKIVLLPEMPKSSNGKIDKKSLRSSITE